MPLRRGRRSSRRQFNGNAEQLFGFERPIQDRVLQGRAVKELQHHEGAAVFLADVVNGADVGMVERRSRTGPRAGSAQAPAGRANLIGKKFEGDEAVKPDVLGLVDDAHAARAYFSKMW